MFHGSDWIAERSVIQSCHRIGGGGGIGDLPDSEAAPRLVQTVSHTNSPPVPERVAMCVGRVVSLSISASSGAFHVRGQYERFGKTRTGGCSR